MERLKNHHGTLFFCYLHKDCAQDEPIEIIDDEFVETAENCENYEEEIKNR